MARPESKWAAIRDALPDLQRYAEAALVKTYMKALERIVADIETEAARQGTGPRPALVRLIDLRERVSRQIEALTGDAIRQVSALRIKALNSGFIMARSAFASMGVPAKTWSVFNPAAVEAAVWSPYQSVGMIKTFPALNAMAEQMDPRWTGVPAGRIYLETMDAARGTSDYALHRAATVLMGRVWETTQDALIRGLGQDAMARELRDVYKRTAPYIAKRVARTETHHAQIVGLSVAGNMIEQAGGKIRRFWIATSDDRTRESHAEMDRVYEDEDGGWTMPSGEKVDAPGLSTDPAEGINCRCSIGFAVEGLTSERGREPLDRTTIKELE